MFQFNIDTPAWIALAVTLAAAVIALLARFLPILRTARVARFQNDLPGDDEPRFSPRHFPKLSVIVFTFTDEDDIKSYLEAIMSQDYPDFEVILINEGGNETTAALAERLLAIYPQRLYVTFIPPESHSLSRRKLAQTIGIKAAKGDVVLTTASNCIIPSSSWLSRMMQPFCENPSTDIVLGYSHINFENLRGPGKWYRQFDATLTACQWIGAAVNRYPYRGDGNNLAFRRELFFSQKGYSKTMHLMNGDDDLFVKDIATRTNTAVMISSEAILTSDWGDSANRISTDIKERYLFTSRFLPKIPFLRAGLGSCMQWAIVFSAVAAAWLGLPSLVAAIAALAILVVLNVVEIILYRKAARRLGSVGLWWALPFFLLWHPVGNALFKLNHRRHRKKNYTFA